MTYIHSCTLLSLCSDPVYTGQQWVFDMINLRPVWEKGYNGKDVRVRINDSGVEDSHPEFASRFDVDGSCSEYKPQQNDPDAGHGTNVAGIIGSGADNDFCSVGVAPEVTLSSCFVFGQEQSLLAEKLESFDISQNSWGLSVCARQHDIFVRNLEPADDECRFQVDVSQFILPSDYEFPCDVCDFTAPLSQRCEEAIVWHCYFFYNDESVCIEFLDLIVGGRCQFNSLSDQDLTDLTQGINEGRDGKGVIYVFSSGNDFDLGADTNYVGFTNTRFTISVGAARKDGSHASYSTPGASLFLTAPGGDGDHVSNHITAGLDGTCSGINPGTSFSAPVVSGVVALMLEANPDLTWRDVQGILAITSKKIEDDPDDSTAATNAAGISHSNLYGFGMIDATAAVEAAESWELWGPEKILVGESGLVNIALSDDPTSPTYSSVNVNAPNDDIDFIVESVAVYLDVSHFSRGDLEVTLTSPSGTVSVLQPGQRPENTQLGIEERWKLLTVRNWGESASGEWGLSITDIKSGDVDQCADAAWYILSGETEVTCWLLEIQSICVDGSLDPFGQLPSEDFEILFGHVVNGVTAEEACCACGGGLGEDEVVDELRQWRVIVYGRELESDDLFSAPTISSRPSITPMPTLVPTLSKSPSAKPSEGPSFTPSLSPSISPSKMPSTKPSLSPTTTPSSVPSHTPSVSSAPSVLPSNAPSVSHQPTVSSSPSQSPTRTPTIPVNKTKRRVNIIGSTFAVLLVAGTLYFVLRTPKTTTASLGDEFEAKGRIV